MNPFSWIDGWKTVMAGVGLIGLGVYQITQGQIEQGFASVLAGLGMLAAKHGTWKVEKQLEQVSNRVGF